jgi:hypothetical protein
MTLHWINGMLEFECDNCHETLDTATDYFQQAVGVLRREGWTALPPLSENHDWTHRCPACRFTKEAA